MPAAARNDKTRTQRILSIHKRMRRYRYQASPPISIANARLRAIVLCRGASPNISHKPPPTPSRVASTACEVMRRFRARRERAASRACCSWFSAASATPQARHTLALLDVDFPQFGHAMIAKVQPLYPATQRYGENSQKTASLTLTGSERPSTSASITSLEFAISLST